MAIKRLYDTLVGATVNVNQLYDVGYVESRTINGVTFTVQADGSILADGTATGYDVYYAVTKEVYALNHVLFLAGCPNGGSKDTYRIYLDGHGVASYDVGNGTIFKQTQDNNRKVFIYVRSGVTVESKVFKPQVIDLTQMFGSASIADYLYNLETATAGAGIAKLKEWGFLTGEYIPHNSGSLESVEARSHVMRGFNQWDEEWELGIINTSTGQNEANNVYFRSKNYIPIIPDTTYYYKVNPAYSDYGRFAYYDGNKNLIGYVGTANVVNRKFITPANACYMRFWTGEKMSAATGQNPVYANDICINLSNLDRNGEYEPYSTHTYDLGTDTLRGLFKLDSENRLYADGDTKTSDGVITRKYGVVDLGTLAFTYDSAGKRWQVFFANIENFATRSANLIAEKYTADITATAGNEGKTFTIGKALYIYSNDSTTPPSGNLIYPLATPTTETSTPFTNPQICDPDGTEEYVTGNGVPVGHETRYQL